MPSERVQRQIDRLLDATEAALVERDWERVRALAGDVLRLDPDNRDARSFLDACERGDGGAEPIVAPRSTAVTGPSASPLPTSFAGGRYSVRAFLGEGAKKRVYLAHDGRLDRDVAFALIKTGGLDADGLVRVRREAQAMGRLGDHPHIVTIFDTGDEAGAPFIVSQYHGGGSVEDLLATAEGHRIPPDRAMKIAEQVCQALAHAHGRGIIHRDLKPGNVWLAEDGNAALGDFGLAIALDRSRMTVAGMMVGTVAYMAPEQALGRTPDARSDLYALGAMLYEMVCGRPPFLGDDAVGVISQHINTAPVAPAWHNPDVPRALDALILALLAKSPEERPASASEVAAELRRIIEQAIDQNEAPAAPAVPHVLQGLPWGAFVGRREEMDQLKDALEGALSGKGSLAMLVGEPGIGKTRIAEEFAVYAGLRGAQVLAGHCYEGDASLPYRPFIEALRQYVRSRADDELRSQMGPGAPEIATMVSDVRQRFPDIEDAPSLEPEAERLRLFESVTQFLRNASAASPLVLHLDDLHWADKPSLLLLQHVARSTPGDRLLIVGAYRDVELDRTHPLSDALASLRRLPNFHRVLLRGLPLETVTELLGVLEPSEEAAAGRTALATALHRETEGNPFFIREVIAHLIETGKLAHEGGRWVGKVATISDLGIPEGVREVIGRRLSRVSPGCNRMLTAASTMTGGFTWEALRAINGVTTVGSQPAAPDAPGDAQLLDALEEALRAQLVAERKGEAAGTYDFTHALVRQTLYDELSTPRRVLLHRQIAEALEELYADDAEAHLAELAHHFYQAAPGGDVEKAIDYAKRAGERAHEVHAHEEAVAQYERALQALDLLREPDASEQCCVLLALCESLSRAGRQADAAENGTRALAIARGTGDPRLVARAAVSTGLGGFGSRDPRFVPALEEALAGLSPDDSPERALVLSRLALAQQFSRPTDELIPYLDEALGIARRLGDTATLADNLYFSHFIRLGRPQYVPERADLATELEEVARSSADPFHRYLALQSRSFDLAEAGDLARAESLSEERLKMAEAARLPWSITLSALSLVPRPLAEGRFEEAEVRWRRVVELAQRAQLDASAAYGAQLLGLRHLQGRLAELEPVVKDLVERFRLIPSYRCVLAWVYCETNREALAREEFERLAADHFVSLQGDNSWVTSLYLLSEVCAIVGDERRADQLYHFLEPFDGAAIMVAPLVVCQGAAARPLGMMAAVMHRWDDAERHFEDALVFDAKMGAHPWLAHTQYNYARMLATRNAPGDHRRAVELLLEALDTAYELGMKKIIERGLALKIELQGAAGAGVYTSIDTIASAVAHERPEINVHPAPDGTVTIMFSDIEDSTALTERLGDQAWQELLRRHNALIREQLQVHGGYEVKTMGDGFMVAFRSAKKGLDCAIAIQRAFDNHDAADGDHVKVRIGLHAGEAIKDGDDFYGKNVILASRVAGKAAGGEILVSSLLRQLVESSVAADTFSEPRDVELKGLAGSHAVYAVAWPPA